MGMQHCGFRLGTLPGLEVPLLMGHGDIKMWSRDAAAVLDRDVNGSDRILYLPYPLSCFFIGFGAERIMTGCEFEKGYI
jgi:hypothetical protein